MLPNPLTIIALVSSGPRLFGFSFKTFFTTLLTFSEFIAELNAFAKVSFASLGNPAGAAIYHQGST